MRRTGPPPPPQQPLEGGGRGGWGGCRGWRGGGRAGARGCCGGRYVRWTSGIGGCRRRLRCRRRGRFGAVAGLLVGSRSRWRFEFIIRRIGDAAVCCLVRVHRLRLLGERHNREVGVATTRRAALASGVAAKDVVARRADDDLLRWCRSE